jgi:hypothetical protein
MSNQKKIEKFCKSRGLIICSLKCDQFDRGDLLGRALDWDWRLDFIFKGKRYTYNSAQGFGVSIDVDRMLSRINRDLGIKKWKN